MGGARRIDLAAATERYPLPRTATGIARAPTQSGPATGRNQGGAYGTATDVGRGVEAFPPHPRSMPHARSPRYPHAYTAAVGRHTPAGTATCHPPSISTIPRCPTTQEDHNVQ